MYSNHLEPVLFAFEMNIIPVMFSARSLEGVGLYHCCSYTTKTHVHHVVAINTLHLNQFKEAQKHHA